MCGIVHLEHHKETVELRFRKRECTLGFHRVLCSDYEERKIELSCLAVDCNLLLLHALKKARLCSCRSSVDLVGKKDICKERSFAEYESVCLAVEKVDARKIRRQKVDRKLDALEIKIQ